MSKATVREVNFLDRTRGDFGIEIECEADSPLPPPRTSDWRITSDGSLRGHSAEYVSASPVIYSDLKRHLVNLGSCIKDSRVKIAKSFRAAVHVHMNVQELTQKEVFKVAIIYYILETTLLKFCGETRQGNFNCLRLRDAYFPAQLMENAALEIRYWENLNTDAIRYASLNLRSLFRYGSLEFRGLNTDPKFKNIHDWCTILKNIKSYALKMDNIIEVTTDISYKGPDMWAKQVLGEEMFNLVWCKEAEDWLIEDLRNIQPLIYSVGEMK